MNKLEKLGEFWGYYCSYCYVIRQLGPYESLTWVAICRVEFLSKGMRGCWDRHKLEKVRR